MDTHNITSESAIPILKENRVDVVNGWETLRFLWDGWICFVSSLTFDGGREVSKFIYLFKLTSEDVSIYLFQCNFESV